MPKGLALLSLEGLRVLVTGAGTGLGRHMALGLAEAGADLVICGRRVPPLEESAELLRPFGGQVQVIQADVTSEKDRQRLLRDAGRIDVLVNNAGGGNVEPWDTVSMQEWRRVLGVNLDAVGRLCQLFAPPMMERRSGRIVNISSIYGLVGGNRDRYPGIDWDNFPYFASKHGVEGITHYLAARLGPYGVCVNSLCPGMFPSENNERALTPEVRAALIDGTPLRRLGQEDDLKAAIVFLASPGSKFVTGHSLVVDGGWTVW